VVSAVIQALAVPFTFLARREKASSDPISEVPEPLPEGVAVEHANPVAVGPEPPA